MGLISGKCPSCGANLKISESAKGELQCPFCGSTYLVENAVNIVNNEFVTHNDFAGANVVINQSLKDAYIKQYLENARRALNKEDWEEVEKYYNMVEQYEPKNIEAIFYSSYAKARLSLIEDKFKRTQNCEVFCNSISIIDDNYDVSKSDENVKLIIEMSNRLMAFYDAKFVINVTNDSFGMHDDSKITYLLFAKIALSFIESVENIYRIDSKIEYKKLICLHYTFLAGNKGLKSSARDEYGDKAEDIEGEIQKVDPQFSVDIPSGGGCYIATCVYGSYDCPEVWTLRRYRDFKLATTWYGRTFVRVYYALSPTLVKWFGNKKWFKKIWQGKLDKMVTKLQEEGFSSTPYKDKKW